MPARARTKSQALTDLAGRLASLDAAELPGVIDRAEALAGEIDPDELYAEDGLLRRLAAREMDTDNPGVIVGRAILTDLSSVVEGLSELAEQTLDDLGPGALTPGELSQRWSISSKSIARYRREGLIARRVRSGGRVVVMFSARAVEIFERRNAHRLARAGRFSRRTGDEHARLEREARRYRARFGWSLNRVARRIAERRGRSVEGVRQALRRIDENSETPVFEAGGPPDAHERAVYARAARRGIEPADVAHHRGRSVASVRRGATEHRADFLRSLDLSGPSLATFERDEAREVLLGAASVRTGLGGGGVVALGAFVADARARRVPDRAAERTRLIARHFLRHNAARVVAGLDRTTAEPSRVDRAETDLRWASSLKAELIRPHLTLIVETLDAAAGQRLEQVPARELAPLLRRAMRAASRAIDRLDPAREGSIAAPIGLAISRLAAEWTHGRAPENDPARAARVLPADEPFRDWTASLDPWQAEITLDPRVRVVLDNLEPRSRDVLRLRHGLACDGETVPKTLAETAEAMGTSVVHVARFERAAIRSALAAARAR